ncbi:MAG TPA: potassium channel family protein [Thermoanaerobaculales bacterium]|nr:potassium channel family protein [Thermoanaerobaculales bacterium]HQL29124.1 potassium channel family protein [Thermoanaerobaculales bacterium]HQN95046.1 potassium channel family protein [Thermoanaerobaculales bacterium]HQP43034.1 potassium channel family protein [Thermoanaerobaculales bacterium]
MREALHRVVLESRQRTYSNLLVVLTLYLVVVPFVPVLPRLAWIDDYLLVLVLLASLYSISGDRTHLFVGLVLGFPAIASRLVTAHLRVVTVAPATLAALSVFAFLAYLIYRVMRDVLWGRRRTGERIIGAIVAYLLIGLQWSLIYGFVEHVHPGSFAIPANVLPQGNVQIAAAPVSVFVYFSFVTLATLGYGDITPISAAARTFAWSEAIVGQLFIAVTIARLVGIHAAEMAASSRDPGATDT